MQMKFSPSHSLSFHFAGAPAQAIHSSTGSRCSRAFFRLWKNYPRVENSIKLLFAFSAEGEKQLIIDPMSCCRVSLEWMEARERTEKTEKLKIGGSCDDVGGSLLGRPAKRNDRGADWKLKNRWSLLKFDFSLSSLLPSLIHHLAFLKISRKGKVNFSRGIIVGKYVHFSVESLNLVFRPRYLKVFSSFFMMSLLLSSTKSSLGFAVFPPYIIHEPNAHTQNIIRQIYWRNL